MTIAKKHAQSYMPNGELSLEQVIQAAIDEAESLLIVGARERVRDLEWANDQLKDHAIALQERIRQLEAARDAEYNRLNDAISKWAQRALEAERVPSLDILTDLIADGLRGTYHCTRVWSAWGIGTMSEDDFSPVEESGTPAEIAESIISLIAAAPQPKESDK